MAATAKKSSAPSPLSALVDEVGSLEKELAPWRGKLAREELLRKSIRAQYDSAPADIPVSVEGEKFIVALGPKALQSTVNVGKLAKTIGAKGALSIAKVTLEALKAFPGVAGQVVTQSLTGTRSWKIFEKGSTT